MYMKESEISQIEDKLHSTISRLITGCEKLDMDLAFDAFHDSSDFLAMDTGGNISGYRTYLQDNIAYLKNCISFKVITHERHVRVLDDSTAIYSWSYGIEAKQNSNEIDIIENAGASFFFRKIEDDWKVVYYHESYVPTKSGSNS